MKCVGVYAKINRYNKVQGATHGILRQRRRIANRLDRSICDRTARAPELARFDGIVGRVVTVNYNGKAVIDFQDGGWYDITASDDCLVKVDPAEAKAKYKNVNSAQPLPDKQG